MKEFWKVWKYTLGSFDDNKTEKYDNLVCFMRSLILITYIITNCFIVAGVIRQWNSGKNETNIISQASSCSEEPRSLNKAK